MKLRYLFLYIHFLFYTTILSQVAVATNQLKRSQTINSNWVFNYFPGEALDSTFNGLVFDDSEWQAVSIPHTWQTYETTGDLHPFIGNASEHDDPYWWNGWGCYRKHFSIKEENKGRKIFIEFDGVQKNCEIWLNGYKLGSHQGGFNSFYFDLTEFIKFDEDNILAVAVSNKHLDPYRTPPMTAGNWNLYGGIYRDVRFVIKENIYIPFQGSYKHEGGIFVTTPFVTKSAALVDVQTWIKNDSRRMQEITLSTSILDRKGKQIKNLRTTKSIPSGELIKIGQQSDTIYSPLLWSPDKPNMYKVVSEIFINYQIVDKLESPLGFRWFNWDKTENRLYLNGDQMHIHGMDLIPDFPWLGEAFPKWLLKNDLKDIRYNLNCNAIRPHVATADPFVYDWCDKNGLICVEEVPNFKMIDFSESVQEQMVREMIRRDRNHPSIFFWNVGNETSDAADSKWVVEEDTTRIVHARKIYNNSAGDFVEHNEKNMDLENLLRCTVRGWTHKDVKNLEPTNNLVVETSGQLTGTEELQHKMAMIEGGSIRGRIDMYNGMMFCYSDYGCNREYKYCPLKHLNPKGWVDAYRVPKYIYFLWMANYADKPMAFIHPHFWTKHYVGSNQDIVVDSNCEKVEMFLNGKSIGVKYPSWQNFFTVTFRDVKIEKGAIKVVGEKCGKKAKDELIMPREPDRISLSSSHQTIDAGLGSIFVITADIIDKNGIHVFGANNPLSWKVEGPAKLVGPEKYLSERDKHEEMFGTMYIDVPVSNVIRSTGDEGLIKVTVMSPGIIKNSITIKAKKKNGLTDVGFVQQPINRI
jgi:beta-galactosidase